MKTKAIIKQFEKSVIPNYVRYPIAFAKGKGSYLWDVEGKKYLDMFPGWAVSGLGHCHPHVVKAIKKQSGELLHMFNLFYMQPQGELADWIFKKSKGLQSFFCNSGAEANEGAIKLARLHSPKGKSEIITMKNSFHGRTYAAVSATAQPKYHEGIKPIVGGFKYVEFNNINALKKAITKKTCAIMLEPIQGEGGVNIPDKSYMKAVRKLCDDKGLLLILDEVQTGMGRTGKYFAHQLFGIKPDIMTLAKSLGGGVAIGATCAIPEVAKSMKPGTHASTFGGNSLACAAGIAVFETIEKEKLLSASVKKGSYLTKKLNELKKKYPVIKSVRNCGLMIGIDLTKSGQPLVNICLADGLIINCTHDTILRWIPAMTVTTQEIDKGLKLFEGALKKWH
ncbi:MAG: aspartate aminotransferase family protein [Planctomycetota bacterium]|nr:MAG: aspartate aminotransferase family protein [Planctomycetota bacterium]